MIRRARPDLEPRCQRRADHLLRRNAVYLFGPGAHELDIATRDDEGLEPVVPKISDQFQHRLVHQLGIGALEARMPRRCEPIDDDLLIVVY
jgi:hypothetical protein